MRPVVRSWVTVAVLGVLVVVPGCSNTSATGTGPTAGTAVAITTTPALPVVTTAAPSAKTYRCDLVSLSEASAAEGHAVTEVISNFPTVRPPKVTSGGCSYYMGKYYISWGFDTYERSYPQAEYAKADISNNAQHFHVKPTAIGGLPAVTWRPSSSLEITIFYDAQTNTQWGLSATSGKAGATIALANLITQRL